MTYYEDLGVQKNATEAEVKKAYRKKAQRAHPDKGGDPQEFHRLTRAYETLSDPGKREYYDAHGSDKPQDQAETMALQMMAQALLGLIDQVDVDYTNIIEAAGRLVQGQLEDVRKKLRQVDQAIKRREKALERLKGSKSSMAADLISGDLAVKAREKAAGEEAERVVLRVIELLKEHKYEVENRPPENVRDAYQAYLTPGMWR